MPPRENAHCPPRPRLGLPRLKSVCAVCCAVRWPESPRPRPHDLMRPRNRLLVRPRPWPQIAWTCASSLHSLCVSCDCSKRKHLLIASSKVRSSFRSFSRNFSSRTPFDNWMAICLFSRVPNSQWEANSWSAVIYSATVSWDCCLRCWNWVTYFFNNFWGSKCLTNFLSTVARSSLLSLVVSSYSKLLKILINCFPMLQSNIATFCLPVAASLSVAVKYNSNSCFQSVHCWAVFPSLLGRKLLGGLNSIFVVRPITSTSEAWAWYQQHVFAGQCSLRALWLAYNF